MPVRELADQTGLVKSWVTRMESGDFQEVGLDKFARIVSTLGLSADQLLGEAGLIPKQPHDLPNPREYLRTIFHLSEDSLNQAIEFIEFLTRRERAKKRTKP